MQYMVKDSRTKCILYKELNKHNLEWYALAPKL